MADLIVEADQDVKVVLVKVKMENDTPTNMKNLSSNAITTELLNKTLAFLYKCEVTDLKITRLLKKGKRTEILRRLVNMMPEQCRVCQKVHKLNPGDVSTVVCHRCSRPACGDCYPNHVKQWRFLCTDCDNIVKDQLQLPADELAAAKTKKKAKETVAEAAPATQVEAESDEEEDSEESEEGEGDEDEAEYERAEARKMKSKKAKEKKKLQICRDYTFHKCPHGRGGTRPTRERQRCLYDHPKVCSKWEAHGDQGQQGCTKGEKCEAWHPKLCYSSRAVPRVCTRGREKCTFWHTKGTTYRVDADRAERRVPPSNEARRRREEESDRIRRTEETARKREQEDYMRRREAERREGEDRRPNNSNQFLDLQQMIRAEIQQAFRTMFPAAACGNGANPTPSAPPLPPMGWAQGRPVGC
jgi:5-methylcytosine-specific restriction endonuclease McrA